MKDKSKDTQAQNRVCMCLRVPVGICMRIKQAETCKTIREYKKAAMERWIDNSVGSLYYLMAMCLK